MMSSLTSSAVFNTSKIQIESNSQHSSVACALLHCCVQYFKDTNREQFTTIYPIVQCSLKLCSILQRYKSRAIHNSLPYMPSILIAVFNTSKIQIESNSQQRPQSPVQWICCVQYFKDTNREQFTTRSSYLHNGGKLCSILQRYKSRAIHNLCRLT